MTAASPGEALRGRWTKCNANAVKCNALHRSGGFPVFHDLGGGPRRSGARARGGPGPPPSFPFGGGATASATVPDLGPQKRCAPADGVPSFHDLGGVVTDCRQKKKSARLSASRFCRYQDVGGGPRNFFGKKVHL